MKVCPKCGSTRVIVFDSDNDYCEKCKKWFPAVEEIKCETGCKAFTGGEIKHHKDCYFYPESFTKMYDDEKQKNEDMKRDIKRIMIEVSDQILQRPWDPNVGKRGCVTRLNQLLDGKFEGTSKEIYSREEITVEKKLITKLADDVWAVAKKLENRLSYLHPTEENDYDLIKDLKTISGCLHDLRAGHKTKWYHSVRIEQ